ncbi:MAG TPA: histidine kinase, partial [Myxococcota bacterium]|nr:histidine kinase [Myxococcota bacterium]
MARPPERVLRKPSATMHLHTRLLLGIAVVTLLALAVSLIVPLSSARQEVARETQASLQLARLLTEVQADVAAAPDAAAALAAAAQRVRGSEPLRHVGVTLRDGAGATLATSPTDTHANRLARLLEPAAPTPTLEYPLTYRGAPLAALRVSSNPDSETNEIEQHVVSDLALLTATILAVAASIYWIVRGGLRPVAQIQAALTRLQGGDLDARLPHFRLKDLDDISARFNHCAAALQEAAAQRRELTRRLIEVEEEERRRLARELHDELGQSLTAIKVGAAYIAREARESPRVLACAQELEQLAGSIMDLIRGMLARLRPYGLETLGLRAALGELAGGWEGRLGERFRCAYEFEGPVDALPADVSVTVYRLVQECLTNLVRHSRARSVAIRVAAGDGERPALRVEIRELDAPPGPTEPWSWGTGLLGMRERVAAHGGDFTVAPGEHGVVLR